MVYLKTALVLTLSIITCRAQKNLNCNGSPSTGWSCCNSNTPCDVGGGDCDRDSDCLGSLACGSNNCHTDFSGPTSNWASGADCCYDTDINDCSGNPSTDWSCCSSGFPCTAGGGDCDEDSQCQGDLVCGSDNCLNDFSSAGSNWAAGADCCKANNPTTIPVTTTPTTIPVTTTPTTTTNTTTPATGLAPVAIDCDSPFDEEVTVPGTTIISPNHPNNYDNGKDCQIKIRFSQGQRVSIEFLAFSVEPNSACRYDWLEIRDGDSANSNLSGSKLCGTTSPDPVVSTGNTVTLVFHTDSSVVRGGFKIKVELATTPATTTLSPTNPPSGACGVKPASIIGGVEATPFSLPWQVALVEPGDSTPFCGGTLIGPRHVLTAAHCTSWNSGNWDVMVGEHSASDTSDGTRHTKCRHENHAQYNSNTINNDFAIVHLDQPVAIGTRAAPACLPTSDLGGDFLSGKTLTVSGWGNTGSGYPDVLNKVDVPGLTNAVCNEKYGSGRITDQMLCAGNIINGGIDSCQGDSGGPLTYNNGGRATLVGVVSWGRGCALSDYPGVYARVTEVLPWISNQMSQRCP